MMTEQRLQLLENWASAQPSEPPADAVIGEILRELIAEVRRLQQQEQQWQGWQESKMILLNSEMALCAQRDAALAERDALKATNERLTFALAEAQLVANSSWRCFKCGMVLTDEAAARNHFGDEKCVSELRRLSNDMRALCNRQSAALTEARRVLREVEYVNTNTDPCGTLLMCPVCDALPGLGHTPDCALAAVLAQEEK